MSRVQFALNVDDLDEAVKFYSKLFNSEPAKLKDGYANFAIADPPLKLVDQWLDPESLAEWMCPRPVRCVAIDLEPRVGGHVRFDVDDSGNLVLITGRFLVIDRPRMLRFTWSASDWPDPTMNSVVTVAFEPVGDEQTLMSIQHSPLPSDFFDEYDNGWAQVCDQFAVVLEGSMR